MCTPPVVVIRESGLTTNELELTSASQMQCFLRTLTDWTLENDMRINTSKTKEHVIGPWGQHNATLLQTES